MTEYASTTDGLHIAFYETGAGEPVLLLHGFASSAAQNWHDTGWGYTLSRAGRRVLSLDFRGHGESDKPHDPAAYGLNMTTDILAVMDKAGLGSADVMGYSLGSSLALHLAHEYPQKVRRLVAAGIGANYFGPPLPTENIARGLETDCEETESLKKFHSFAAQPGKDRKALAACIRALPPRLTRLELAAIRHPVLVVSGEKDEIAGPPSPLAAAFLFGRALPLPRRDHMSAVGDLTAKQKVSEFFNS